MAANGNDIGSGRCQPMFILWNFDGEQYSATFCPHDSGTDVDCMLSKQFQFGSKGAERRFHAVAVTEPHRDNIFQQAEQALHLALARMSVFGTEVVDVIKVMPATYHGLCIEQRLAILAFGGAWLQFKEYSVGFAWHVDYFSIIRQR